MAKNTQQTFNRALLDAALEEFRDIPAEGDIDLEFSEAFEAWGQSMLASPKPAVRPPRKGLRRLLLIAAILAALVTTAMATPAIREALIKFFPHNAGTHYEFSFDPEQLANAPDTLERIYMPTYIPDGYHEVDYVNIDIAVSVFWESESGDIIHYMQQTIWNSGEGGLTTDAENTQTEMRVINGFNVFCVYSEGYVYHWTDNNYFFSIDFDATLPQSECDKVFSSIAPA